MANRNNRFLIKRSNVPGKVPSAGQLLLGEMALNTADVKLFASGTTANEILPIGWDRVSRTGDTINGDIIINGDLTVTGTSSFNDVSITNISATTINPVDYIQFNTGYTGNTVIEGRMYWDEPNQTISLGLHNNEVQLQLGQELLYLVKNQSGATIENGRVVRASGTLGSSGRILGEYMIADGSIESKFTLGIATEDILNGEDGYVTEFGLVRNINTTGSIYGETWNEGDILWVSPTIYGGLTNVEPSAPNLAIEMAIVISTGTTTGSIFVRPHRYPTSNELQDVVSSGKSENSILQYNTSISAYTNTTTPTFDSVSASTFSGGTFYGDASGLINVPTYRSLRFTGGTSYTFTDFNVVNTLNVNKVTGSTTTVILNQSPNKDEFYVVKDGKGDSVTNPITISGGTYNIDGNPTVQLKKSNKPSLTFLFDGVEYIIV